MYQYANWLRYDAAQQGKEGVLLSRNILVSSTSNLVRIMTAFY